MQCSTPWVAALAAVVLHVPAARAAVASADARFAQEAAAAGMEEVAEGKLARERAADPAVRRFAERMVEDHTRAGDQLHQVAASENLSLPAHLDKSAGKELDALTKLHGPAFDKAYMKHNVSAHDKAVKEFGKEAKSGHDAGLRHFAAETLPTLEEHRQLAQSTAREAGASKPH